MTEIQKKKDKLREILEDLGSVVVAFSGGVDSTLLLKVAVDVLGEKVLAVTVNSPIHPEVELEEAAKVTQQLGAKHLVIENNELENEEFTANPPDRCYVCKKNRFLKLREIQQGQDFNAVVEGSNVDDAGDYRPGSKAVVELGVRSPLKEAGLTKDEIRQLSHELNLPTWDKPSSPCLATRVPYGQHISPRLLEHIRWAEMYLKEQGFRELRVRVHGNIARIEVPRQDFAKITERNMLDRVIKYFKELEFDYITLDLQGFRSGSMNEVLKDSDNG